MIRSHAAVADPPDAPGDDRVDPRFVLANERTLLAWVRTGLALVAAGLAVPQLLPPTRVAGGGEVVGLALIGLGVPAVVGGYLRWRAAERTLGRHEPLPATRLPLVVSLTTVLVALVAAALVLVGPP